VQYSEDLENWETLFTWVCWPNAGLVNKPAINGPIMHQFGTFSNKLAIFHMKEDYSGFEITPTTLLSNKPNVRAFWRTIP
jgi:hypothetical protein